MQIQQIPNQLITGQLQKLNTAKLSGIALHHMAHPLWGVKEVESYHVKSLGWLAIGYNFWVSFDGVIYEGRGFNIGAGVASQNSTVISVGFQGDYENANDKMPTTQFNAGIDIINYIKGKVPSISKVGGHKDFMATSCPGRHFPLVEMIKGIKRSDFVMFKDVKQDDYAYNHIKKLKECGIVNGDTAGNFNPDMPITRRDMSVVAGNVLTYLGK